METFAKWFIVAMMGLHIFFTVAAIDQPRKLKPVTAAHGILTAVFWGLYIAAIVMWWET